MCTCHLVLLQTAFLNHLVTLLLEGDDDKSHKDVDEEERKDDKVNHVENGHFHPVPSTGAHALLCNIGRVLQDSGRQKQAKIKYDSHVNRLYFFLPKRWE